MLAHAKNHTGGYPEESLKSLFHLGYIFRFITCLEVAIILAVQCMPVLNIGDFQEYAHAVQVDRGEHIFSKAKKANLQRTIKRLTWLQAVKHIEQWVDQRRSTQTSVSCVYV